MELIKNILFYTATISGSICIILLFLCAVYKCFCIFLDHCKNANVLRKCIQIYIKRNRPDIKIELENIDIAKNGIHRNKGGLNHECQRKVKKMQ